MGDRGPTATDNLGVRTIQHPILADGRSGANRNPPPAQRPLAKRLHFSRWEIGGQPQLGTFQYGRAALVDFSRWEIGGQPQRDSGADRSKVDPHILADGRSGANRNNDAQQERLDVREMILADGRSGANRNIWRYPAQGNDVPILADGRSGANRNAGCPT